MFHLRINTQILLFSLSMLYLRKATVRTYMYIQKVYVCMLILLRLLQTLVHSSSNSFQDSDSLFSSLTQSCPESEFNLSQTVVLSFQARIHYFPDYGSLFSRTLLTLFQTGPLFPASGFTLTQTLGSLFSRLWADSFPDSGITFSNSGSVFFHAVILSFQNSFSIFLDSCSLFSELFHCFSDSGSLFSESSSLFSRPSSLFFQIRVHVSQTLLYSFPRLWFTLFQLWFTLFQTLVHPYTDSGSLLHRLWFTLFWTQVHFLFFQTLAGERSGHRRNLAGPAIRNYT